LHLPTSLIYTTVASLLLYLGWPLVIHNSNRVKNRANAAKKLIIGSNMIHFKREAMAMVTMKMDYNVQLSRG
jgi:hypothetical protein